MTYHQARDLPLIQPDVQDAEGDLSRVIMGAGGIVATLAMSRCAEIIGKTNGVGHLPMLKSIAGGSLVGVRMVEQRGCDASPNWLGETHHSR